MDITPSSFIPPAPKPRTTPPSALQMLRIVFRNPIELWGEPSYTQPWVHIKSGIGGPLLVANDPKLVRHILVENAKNYHMARVRQKILRPILRDGLLTAEGDVWKRSRKTMAPVFTPRHIQDFAQPMARCSRQFITQFENMTEPFDMAQSMTQITYDILAQTLFSGEIAGDPDDFVHKVEHLLTTMGRVDPLDLLAAPDWLPRIGRLRGRKTLSFFRKLVLETMQMRRDKIKSGADVPQDFLTLLLNTEGKNGLSEQEIEDNIITFIGAGHETTARALAWTFYLLAKAPHERIRVEEEVDRVVANIDDPYQWIDAMPYTRAAFEEAMRLYPPAPSINREPFEDQTWGDLEIAKGTQVLVMPWVLHRHRLYWEKPDHFIPQRFWPENRDKIDRFQYLPFGAGPRVCIGSSFALIEAMIVMATMMHSYRFDMADDAPEPWPVQKLTVQPNGGLKMVATKR